MYLFLLVLKVKKVNTAVLVALVLLTFQVGMVLLHRPILWKIAIAQYLWIP